MDFCFFDKQHLSEVFKIENKGIKVCMNCMDKLHQIKEYWVRSEIDPDNDICKMCFMNVPLYLDISKNPVEKLCYSCASAITCPGPRMLINIKWKSIIKSQADIKLYKEHKFQIQIIKKGFKTLTATIDDSLTRILDYKLLLNDKIDKYFDKQCSSLDEYKKDLISFCTSLRDEAKNNTQNGNLSNSLSPGAQLITNKKKREELFRTRLINLKSFEIESVRSSLAKIKTVSLTSLSDLICDLLIIIFYPGAQSMSLVSMDDLTVTKVTINSQVLWKTQAFWCMYENGEVLYTGGDYNKSPSDVCYLIRSNYVVKEIKKFTPKKSHFLCLFDGIVYSFGGSDKVTEMYLKEFDYWVQLGPSPEELDRCSACAVPEGILISTYKTKYLYLYNVQTNSYSKIDSKVFSKNTPKLLLSHKKFLFCITKKKVFRSELDQRAWKEVSKLKNEENWNSIMTPRVMEDKIYFIQDNLSLWAFSTLDYSVTQVPIPNS
jgi:hypothetical protein